MSTNVTELTLLRRSGEPLPLTEEFFNAIEPQAIRAAAIVSLSTHQHWVKNKASQDVNQSPLRARLQVLMQNPSPEECVMNGTPRSAFHLYSHGRSSCHNTQQKRESNPIDQAEKMANTLAQYELTANKLLEEEKQKVVQDWHNLALQRSEQCVAMHDIPIVNPVAHPCPVHYANTTDPVPSDSTPLHPNNSVCEGDGTPTEVVEGKKSSRATTRPTRYAESPPKKKSKNKPLA